MSERAAPAPGPEARVSPRAATRGDGIHRSGGEIFALGALVFLIAVTLVWWTVALWPSPDTLPGWLQTARSVCFGTHRDGLPNAGGWILLIGEPVGMVLALSLVWREPLSRGLRGLAARLAGRAALGVAALVVLAGASLAGARVLRARAHPPAPAAEVAAAPRKLSGPAPALGLVDQHGAVLELDRFRGRPVLVTFAYAQCETVCPILVDDAMRARARLGASAPALVVVTLDPWRDVPARLPHIAEHWKLDEDAFVLSGEVEAVMRVLAAWGTTGARDPRTGEIAHLPRAFLVDATGALAFSSEGSADLLLAAAGLLPGDGAGRELAPEGPTDIIP